MSYSPATPKKEKVDQLEKYKVDPNMLRIAKQSYRDFVDMYSHRLPRPMGIVVNKNDGRGKMIYSQLILLPSEVFIPIELIEA
jgi:hypothetical protein